VSIGAFAIAIVVVVRQLVTVRVRAILRAIHHFRHGTWRIRLPRHALDEIECLAEAFRRLGPHLDRAFTTFVECDRKATVARLGAAYERAMSPLAHRLRMLGNRTLEHAAHDPLGQELQELAMTMLAEMGRLGRPEHPAVSEILQPFGSAGRVAPGASHDVSEHHTNAAGCPDGLVATRRSAVPSIGGQDEPRVA
jgi:HAMP domain-containing protein